MPVMEAEKEKSTVMVDEDEILKMSEKIQQNIKEDENFSKTLDEFLNGKLPKNEVLTVGSTPNILHIIDAKSNTLTVNQSVIENCLNDESIIKDGHTSGHNIPLDTLKQLPENIRNPVLVCKGSRENSIIAITELKNKDDKNIFVPIVIDVNGAKGTINKILSAYGKDNLDNYLRKSLENGSIIAYNKEKASELSSITRANSLQTSTITCFDNSIAYSDKNVNTILPENSRENTENLLPILNAKYRSHLNQIDNFNEKKSVCADKIDYRQGKIDKLTSKADRLEQTNRMLKSMFANSKLSAPVNYLVQRNEEKVKQIRDERIPKHTKKIDLQNIKIENLNHKIDVKQCKADKLQNLSSLIKSFGILNRDERHKQFSSSLDGLHNASQRSLQFKLDKCDLRLNKLSEKYLNTESSVEKLNITKQMSDLREKRSDLSTRLTKLQGISQPFSQQSDITMDKLMQQTEKNISQSVNTEKLDINNLAENICVNNAEYLMNAEMAMEDDYNSLDGIINNGSKHEKEDELQEEIQRQAQEKANSMTDDEKKNFLNETERTSAASPVDVALNDVLTAELIKKNTDFSKDNWLDTLIDTGKAEIKEDGSFKINSDYYKKIPREDKLINKYSEKTANDIMAGLAEKGIEFSAVSRANDIVAITVDRKDEAALNALFDKDIVSEKDHISRNGKQISLNETTGQLDSKSRSEQDVSKMTELQQLQYTVDTDINLYGNVQPETLKAFLENGYDVVNNEAVKLSEPQKNEPLKVNSEYYKSLTKENRHITTQPKDIAEKIMNELDTKSIPYSAVSRNNEMVAITVSKDNLSDFQKAETSAKEKHVAEYINPEFYKAIDKSERFTQRMPEEQARQAEVELKRKGIGYSAVMNGEKSAVTIDKKDSQRATFSRKQLQKSANHLKNNRSEQAQNKNKNRGEEL